MTFQIIPGTQEDADFINSKIDHFNKAQLAFTGANLEVPIRYLMKEEGNFIAGIDAYFYLESVLYIHVLFVHETYRQKKFGSLLLEKVEEEARAQGGTLAHLDTFDFQAKDFYGKHGYEIFGVLEDCPKGHKRYYLRKSLA